MKIENIFYIFIIFIFFIGCDFPNNKRNHVLRIDSVGGYIYNIKDTVSSLDISYDEYTWSKDAIIDSGTLFISEQVFCKIQSQYYQRGKRLNPNLKELYLTGPQNIKSILFGDSSNYWLHWHDKFKITGKAIDIIYTDGGGDGILFKVESYKKIEQTQTEN